MVYWLLGAALLTGAGIFAISQIIMWLSLAAALLTMIGVYILLVRLGMFEDWINALFAVAAGLLMYKMFAGLLVGTSVTIVLLVGAFIAFGGGTVVTYLAYTYILTQ